MKEGNKFGAHRVLEPKGVLPQPAQKIDNDMNIYDNEILIDVKALNIDSASFRQLKEANKNAMITPTFFSNSILVYSTD